MDYCETHGSCPNTKDFWSQSVDEAPASCCRSTHDEDSNEAWLVVVLIPSQTCSPCFGSCEAIA